MSHRYSTDTGKEYGDAERTVAEDICRSECNRAPDRMPLWCPNWNWHVYAAKRSVERHRTETTFRQTLYYFQAVSTAADTSWTTRQEPSR